MYIVRVAKVTNFASLRAVTSELQEPSCIDPVAWVWRLEQLRLEVFYLPKNGPYWNILFSKERRMRSKHGRTIMYETLATFGLASEFRSLRFCSLKKAFSQNIKLPHGFCVDLPSAITYCMRGLCDDELPW